MKREDDIFDRRIRELVDSYDEMPGQEVWEGIEKGLVRRKLHAGLRRAVFYSAAAVLVAGMFFGVLHYPYNGGEDISVVTAEVLTDGTSGPEAGEGESQVLYPDMTADRIRPVRAVKGKVEMLADAGTPHVIRRTAVPAVPECNAEDSGNLSGPEEMPGQPAEDVGEKTVTEIHVQDNNLYSYGSDVPDAGERRERKPFFSISTSGLLSPTNATGNVDFGQPNYTWGDHGSSGLQGIQPVYGIRHYFPVSVGMEVKCSFLNDRLGVGLGVNYTFLSSNYEALVNFNGPFQGTVEQSIHYIGVPLNLYVGILSGDRLSFYANIGCMMERAVKISYDITDLYSAKYRKTMDPHGVQWSANVGIGLEYRFLDFLGLYVDPRLTYFFDCNQPYSVRTEQPLQFNLELGFRFHI